MKKNGFTIFFAVLVGSLALSIGLAMYDLTVRELALSATVTQSQYALFAADSGAECALYWDNKFGGSGSAFASTSAYTPATSVLCNGQTVSVAPATASSTGVVTSFNLNFTAPTQTYCATVDVRKYVSSNVLYTTVTSHGFNTCQAGANLRLERALQVSY